jgi:hypothetical protein
LTRKKTAAGMPGAVFKITEEPVKQRFFWLAAFL